MARNECQLRLDGTEPGLDEAGDLDDRYPDPAGRPDQAELREFVRTALGGLKPAEREVIELDLRHDLHGADLAAVLGVPRNQAHELATGARGQLERGLGALLAARTGRRACPDLDMLLDGWDGELTPPDRKQIDRHIDQCDICADRIEGALRPALQHGMVPLFGPPLELRDEVLQLCTSSSPGALAYRRDVTQRAGPFRENGFPEPIRPPRRRVLALSGMTAAVAAVVIAITATGIVAAIALTGSHPKQSATAAAQSGQPSQSSGPADRRHGTGQQRPGQRAAHRGTADHQRGDRQRPSPGPGPVLDQAGQGEAVAVAAGHLRGAAPVPAQVHLHPHPHGHAHRLRPQHRHHPARLDHAGPTVVADVIAGDADGFGAAYDQYGASLYTYCRSVLPEGEAAEAVLDVFLIAAVKLDGLGDPGRLGAWLRAVARNECLRRLGPAAGGLAPAAGGDELAAVTPPAGLRGKVLAACTDNTPAGRARRVSVAHRAGAFDQAGFPRAIGPSGPRWWQRRQRRPGLASAAGLLVPLARSAGSRRDAGRGRRPAPAGGGRGRDRHGPAGHRFQRSPGFRPGAGFGRGAEPHVPGRPGAPGHRPGERHADAHAADGVGARGRVQPGLAAGPRDAVLAGAGAILAVAVAVAAAVKLARPGLPAGGAGPAVAQLEGREAGQRVLRGHRGERAGPAVQRPGRRLRRPGQGLAGQRVPAGQRDRDRDRDGHQQCRADHPRHRGAGRRLRHRDLHTQARTQTHT